mmetsp:Transcript_12568/g.18788  ORF Transcript_12568/g.18788 Transcript_12568/m.18788 type:complete len:111 (+) Transcript_12568:172-504(+)
MKFSVEKPVASAKRKVLAYMFTFLCEFGASKFCRTLNFIQMCYVSLHATGDKVNYLQHPPCGVGSSSGLTWKAFSTIGTPLSAPARSRARFATVSNACSTLVLSLALVSK